MKQSILIVEDEPSITILLKYNIEKAGYLTDVAYNGEDAVQKAQAKQYDLIVLDIMLPKMDGLDVCQTLRNDGNDVPILILTAKDSEKDRIKGLELGADDYLTKPFSPKELIARMKAILRRVNRHIGDDHTHVIGELEIDEKHFKAQFKGEPLSLTRKEFELLAYLTKHKNKILSREQLLSAVWDYDFVGDTRIVDVHISRLRDKIETDKRNPTYIHTVRGFGYKMEENV